MLKDHFVRACLVCIVFLLAVIACRTNPPSIVHAADPTKYLVTGNEMRPDVKATEKFNALLSAGWKLHSVGLGGTVWYK